MTGDPFLTEDFRVLTPEAFDFVLNNELKRAVRSQNFLTLVVLETQREWDGITVTADDGTLDEVARIIGHEVRDTDLIGSTDTGLISLALLDADYENGTKVIDRLVQRIDDYEFTSPLRISLGAACYPTHAGDPDSLKQQALSHPVVNWRAGSSDSKSTRH